MNLRAGALVLSLGMLGACAGDESTTETPTDAALPTSDELEDASTPADEVAGDAASLPPVYARELSDDAPTCAFDADCSDGDLCDHGLCVNWWRMKGEVPEVDPETLYWQVQRGEVQILDVRTATEFRLGRIEGAVHVPIQKLPAMADALPVDKDKPVVAICLTAHRSIAAVRLLSRHGYDVVQLQGGMTAWARAKLPVVRGKPVDQEN